MILHLAVLMQYRSVCVFVCVYKSRATLKYVLQQHFLAMHSTRRPIVSCVLCVCVKWKEYDW